MNSLPEKPVFYFGGFGRFVFPLRTVFANFDQPDKGGVREV
jgi:hypothetical protein